MAVCVGNRYHENPISSQNEGNVVWKAWQVDSPIATRPLPPKKRMLHDGCAGALHLLPKPHPQAGNSRFIISSRALGLRARFSNKLESEAHPPGAVRRNRANTSLAGIVFDSPASSRWIRRASSVSHADSAPGSGSISTLSSNWRASFRRWSGGRISAS